MSTLFAQDWVYQQSGTTNTLWSVSFKDAFTGTVVGDSGTILRTTNGGINWIPQNSGTFQNLRSTAFYDYNNGIIVGDSGYILKTTDGGVTWIKKNSGTEHILKGVAFCSDTNVIAVGFSGTILRSVDTGNVWAKINSGTSLALLDVSFGDSQNGIAIGQEGAISRTEDGGLSWNTFQHDTRHSFVAISYANEKIYHVISHLGLLLSTRDGGLTWSYRNLGGWMTDIDFIDHNHGAIVNSGVKTTTNGGINWDLQHVRFWLNSLSIADSITRTAVGVYGTIIRTYSPNLLQDKVQLIYPPQNALDIPIDSSTTPPYSIVFRWNLFTYLASSYARYKIEIATDSCLSELLTIKFSDWNVNDTTMSISIFQAHKKYYWKIYAIDEGWQTSSDVWSFTIGPPRFGIIKGLVFEDENQNGIKDINEQCLSNRRVVISGKAQLETSTNEIGEYYFDCLDSGQYMIGVFIQSGWEITYPDSESYNITLNMNDTISSINFGVRYKWCSVEGVVFHDQDENGILNQNDRLLNDWEICLIGDQTIYTWTDERGYFEFNRLLPSVYHIRIGGVESGWEQLTPRDNEGYLIEFRSYGERITDNDFGMKRIPVRVKLKMSVKDNYPMIANLYWGIRPGASYGIWGADPRATNYDFSEDEYDLPPPISGFFDVRFVDPTLATNRFGLGAYTDMRDFTSPTEVYTYRINFAPGRAWGGDYPMTFNWTSSDVQQSFPNGDVELVDKYGSRFDMKTKDSLVITDRSITYLRLLASGPNIPTEYLKSWKMISLPVDVIDNRIGMIFRVTGSKAFSYSEGLGYQQSDTLVPGIGYWLKCSWMLDSSQLIGMPRFNDTIPIYEGWNMIGALSVPFPVGSITTIPSGLVNGIFFGYSGSYVPTDTLKPFQAYWVKSSEDGDLILDAWGGVALKGESKYSAFERIKEKCNTLSFSAGQDAAGNEQELYFTTSDNYTDITSFELPPVPPSGIFDIRYGSNRMIEVVEEGKEKEIPIMISSGEYPITLRWRLNSSTVTASLKIDGKEIPLRVNGSTDIRHQTSHISLALRGVPNIPQEFSLEQNYPNPFNPVTVIRYQLPGDVGRNVIPTYSVTLRVYNILGQEVVTLVDRIEDAGYKSVDWDAAGQASGVYIYKLEATRIANYAEAFTQVRKMILIR
ncbi:MAG: YCF48-related protein [Bacteroidota bacterium]|nr:YCF48-related protein [Bacteroidota bacterium]